jgi:hypothetical protein
MEVAEMKRWFARVAVMSAIILLAAVPALAQTEGKLELKLNRDFGYGGFGEIQGLFSMKASGPEGLVRVDFTIDDTSIGEATQAPFKIQFHTDSFSPGAHTLTAVGYLADGSTLRSNEIRVKFLSKDAAGKAVTKVIVPLVGIVLLIVVGTAVATLLAARRRRPVPLGQPRKYGLSGGTICRKCGRPFALPPLGLNLLVGRLAVCPHCGKWSVARSMPLDALRAAEEAELARGEGAPQVTGPDEEEALRRAIDESRYQE